MFDTYRRELERYDHYTIESAEKFFGIDSIAIIRLLDLLSKSNNSEQERWLLSIRLLDDINAFGYDISNKNTFIEKTNNNFLAEFKYVDQRYLKPLNDKYPAERSSIDQAFSGVVLSRYSHVLLERCKELTSLSRCIQDSLQYQNTTFDVDRLMSSFIHMTMNRIFRSKNRQFELVIYYFLTKHSKSDIAKLKKEGVI